MIKNKIVGKAYVLGDNIDTDQIIPAQYLVYNPAHPEERKMFGRFALIGLPEGRIPFVKEGAAKSDYKVIIAGKNFGCGSSREHAPLSLQESGVEVVVAEFYARIFFRNSVNGGYLIPYESKNRLSDVIQTNDEVEVDIPQNKLRNLTTGKSYELKPLGEILPILEAGDVFKYAKQKGIIK